MLKSATLLPIVLVACFATSSAQQVQKVPKNPLSEDDKLFAKEFKQLMQKYPATARRFVVADLGPTQTDVSFTPSIYECERFEDMSLGFQWVECHAEEPQ